MELEVLADEGATVRLAARGRLTQSELARRPDPMGELLGPGGYGRSALLSLSQAEYIDSAAIGWLLSCNKRFREQGGRLVLHSASPTVADTLQIMRMDRVFLLAENEGAAAALLQERV